MNTACSGGGSNDIGVVRMGAVDATPAASVATPAPLLAAASTLSSSVDWPTYAHDLSRTSTQPGSSGISRATIGGLQVVWYYRSSAAYDTASPIESGGIVYAADVAGNLVAISSATGTVVWKRSFGTAIKETPAVYDGHLFVGTFVNVVGSRSAIYALDPATGATQWEATVPGGIHGSPVAIDGQLFVPVTLGDPGFCNPGGVYEFDESTGGSGLNWLVGGKTSNNGGAVWGPLTYDGSRILYGTGNTCITSPQTSNAVVALATNLQMLWADQTANPHTDDDVGGGVIEGSRYAYVTGKNGNLYAIDPGTGTIAWQKYLGVPDLFGSYATPSIAANTLITSVGYRYNPYETLPEGTQYGGLEGFDPSSGAVKWQVVATAPFYNPPAIVGDVAIVTIDSALAALDPATGTELWSTPLESASRSDVAIANDQIVVADSEGYLYAFGLPTPANADLRARAARSLRIVPNAPQFVNHIPKFCLLK